ncbi:hypothetical protein ABIA39_000913 [Nocardia sp. GAS34]|uniref:hypothetical protein n=1 Tax=unclassified Nocardia TaxID=2637762 RepID=UPI003D1B1707
MTDDRPGPEGSPDDWHDPSHESGLGELTEELRLLAEAVLERVEPMLRRASAEGRAEWGGCGWCPVCAAAALARGEHHDVVAALAGHGTAIVTVLREALAGVPVDPVMPTDSGTPPEGRIGEPGDAAQFPASGETSGTAGDRATPGPESRSGRLGPDSPPGGTKPRYVSIPVQINR